MRNRIKARRSRGLVVAVVLISILFLLALASTAYLYYESTIIKKDILQKSKITEQINSAGGTEAIEKGLSSLEDEKTNLETEIEKVSTESVAVNTEYTETNEAYKAAKVRNEELSSFASADDYISLNSEYHTLKNKYDTLFDDYKKLHKKKIEKIAAEQASANPSESEKVAYLTFDDGPSGYTEQILSILKDYGIKATFFCNWKPTYKSLYAKIVESGNAIGNHTRTHQYSTVYKSPESFLDEVLSFNEKIYEATGFYPTVFRFPGGSSNTVYRGNAAAVWKDTYTKERKLIYAEIDVLNSLGMQYFDWNVDSGDAGPNSPLTKEQVYKNVVNGAGNKNKIIILMHDLGASKKTTVAALPDIIEALTKKGYVFDVLTPSSFTYRFIAPKNS